MIVNEITVCNCCENLKKIRTFVADQLQTLPFTKKEKHHIVLAVDEACANALTHGKECRGDNQLKVVAEKKADSITFRISDFGNFVPTQAQVTTYTSLGMKELVKAKQKGGLGLRLMHCIMDEVNYYRRNDTMVCMLKKRLNAKNAKDANTTLA